MIVLSKLTKLLLIGTAVFLLTCCFDTKFAYADGNSIAPGTLILTPHGNVPIEILHSVLQLDIEAKQRMLRFHS